MCFGNEQFLECIVIVTVMVFVLYICTVLLCMCFVCISQEFIFIVFMQKYAIALCEVSLLLQLKVHVLEWSVSIDTHEKSLS